MRHKVAGRKLNRTPSHRRSLFRNMATSLFMHERIVTTLPKAKDLRPIAEKLITQGKKGTLHARRKILSYIRVKEIAHKVMDEIAPRYADRDGGYTRILKLGYRDGDKAEMALIELVGVEETKAEEKAGKKAEKEAIETEQIEAPEESEVEEIEEIEEAEEAEEVEEVEEVEEAEEVEEVEEAEEPEKETPEEDSDVDKEEPEEKEK